MTHRRARRRSPKAALAAALAVSGLVTLLGYTAMSSAAPPPVVASVDFGVTVGKTDPANLGVVSSTYGATPLSSPAQAAAERKLDARYIRIPVGYRNGRVTSSAGGTGGTLDVPALVAMYRSWGFRVLAVIGGRTDDVDVKPGDATKIMQALGFAGIDYTAPNEPGNVGLTVQNQIDLATMIVREGRALKPDFKIWGPVWAYYDRGKITTFASALGTSLAGVDYHHYAMGSQSISTALAMSQTPSYGQEVRQLNVDLLAAGHPVPVDVDELNFSWRYNDGTPGGNTRFFTAVNNVWMTSAIGHILQAGGRAMPYATQNGPLGIMVQAGQVNPDNRPASSPMPAYWAVANWTGGKMWPHFKNTFYSTTSSDPIVETFAVNNEAGGYNVVLVNKDESVTKNLALTLRNTAAGTYTAYRNDDAAPYVAPGVVATNSYGPGNGVALSLPPMTVTVLVMKPSSAVPIFTLPGAPTNAAATLSAGATVATVTWNPPLSDGGSTITGYRVGRDGSDSTGGGTYSTVVSAASRVFTFTLLKSSASYTFSVQAVSAVGTGPAWTSPPSAPPSTTSTTSTTASTSAPPTTPATTKSSTTATTTTASVFGPPTALTASGGTDPTRVTLSWRAPTSTGGRAITGYRVSRDGTDSTGGGGYTTLVGPTAATFTFSLLHRRTAYHFTVAAVSGSVSGAKATTTLTTG